MIRQRALWLAAAGILCVIFIVVLTPLGNKTGEIEPEGVTLDVVNNSAEVVLATPKTKPRAYVIYSARRNRFFECFRLARALLLYNTRYQTLCATLEPESAVDTLMIEAAAKINMSFVHWTPFWPPSERWDGWGGIMDRWRLSWEKMNMFKMNEYDALAYFDQDIVMKRAPDELLDAVSSQTPFAITFGMDSCQYPYGQNGGVYVVHPSPNLLQALMRFIDQPCEGREKPHCSWLFGGADQSVMALFGENAESIASGLGGHPPLVLSHIYNSDSGLCECKGFGNSAGYTVVYHFMVSSKPWDQGRDHPQSECTRPIEAIYWAQADETRTWLGTFYPDLKF